MHKYFYGLFGMAGSMAIDPSVLDSETMTLTARQFEAVRTRVNTLTATMRRRMEQAATRKDIREVFTSGPLSPQPVVSSLLHVASTCIADCYAPCNAYVCIAGILKWR